VGDFNICEEIIDIVFFEVQDPQLTCDIVVVFSERPEYLQWCINEREKYIEC
jgi:hypothetical protein